MELLHNKYSANGKFNLKGHDSILFSSTCYMLSEQKWRHNSTECILLSWGVLCCLVKRSSVGYTDAWIYIFLLFSQFHLVELSYTLYSFLLALLQKITTVHFLNKRDDVESPYVVRPWSVSNRRERCLWSLVYVVGLGVFCSLIAERTSDEGWHTESIQCRRQSLIDAVCHLWGVCQALASELLVCSYSSKDKPA